MSITQPVCAFVALGIQQAMCMHHIIICGCPALQHFPTSSHKQHSLKIKLWNIKCAFRVSLQLLSETFFILRTEGDKI